MTTKLIVRLNYKINVDILNFYNGYNYFFNL